jgi:hypothetical protein
MKMTHSADPDKEILTELSGAQEDFSVTGVDVLMAIYRRPEKTAGGIILTDNVQGEDLYQGKVGLILKVGPLVNSRNQELDRWFGGKLPKVGDWIVVRVGDTYAFNLNKVPCRLVEAKQIRGAIVHPDQVW